MLATKVNHRVGSCTASWLPYKLLLLVKPVGNVIFMSAVRVEKDDSVSKLLFRRTAHHAAERRDADTARQEHSGSRHIVMESQASGRTFELNCGAKRHRL